MSCFSADLLNNQKRFYIVRLAYFLRSITSDTSNFFPDQIGGLEMKRVKVKFALSFIAICFLLISNARAATRNSATCSQPDVQSQVNAAIDGDTILIPPGSCTWTTAIKWSNKNITLQGAGIGSTVITFNADPGIAVTADTKASFRITGMTINIVGVTAGSIHLRNNTSTVRSGWRIDHVIFNATNGSQANASHPIMVIGLLWGLVDNCTFNDNGYGQQSVSHYAYVNGVETSDNVGRISWENVAVGLGTDSAVYVEDCTFNHSTTQMSAVNDTQYGGRMVIRYNTIYNSMVMTHSAWGSVRGGLKFEVYNNTFTSTSGYYRPALIRSGTGVIFNNTISGNYQVQKFSIDNERSCLAMPTLCNGSDPTYDKNTSGEQGWPCEDQIGRSGGAWKNQPSDPWYAWNNGTYALAPNGGCSSPQVKATPHSNGEVDYVNNGSTPKPGYTAYTYPHPLRQGGGTSLTAAQNQGGGTPLTAPQKLRIGN